ncbi:glycosyltransferase family 2 protein [Botrimarina mediterranea]|uniref:glycosyltransferase family 2 protein n=1 Tax=Botrimarina mediterranea TaxID=2528022 RepID=UPI00118A8962|nr:UDP-Glc:alpha-D-GlcNAc-diphosphoundecaprenol beta-1,3-glucosyltransferase WfgD [Planctomycetes bacterium K2D]
MQPLTFQHPETPGLVSIITPMRNGRAYLQEALDGIAAQTYDAWELVIVEDGSPEPAEDVVRAFASAHPNHRVTYLRNDPSCGAAYSRNRAFLESRGEYIAFLDCDDRWLPTHLDACVSSLVESGDDLAYSTVVMFASSDHALLGLWGPTPEEVQSFPTSLFGRSFVTPSATVVRRYVVGEVGPWDAGYRCCEDADFMMRAASAGKRFRYVGGAHCLYRKEHAGATTQRLAETIEEFAAISTKHLGMPGARRGRCSRAIASSLELAAKLHTSQRQASDPSVQPARAALLYYTAWRMRPKRWKNLVRAGYCRLRHGFDAGVQRVDRPSLPGSVTATPQRHAA